MMSRRILASLTVAVLLGGASASPPVSVAPPAAPAQAGLAVTGIGGKTVVLGADDLGRLPSVQETVAFDTEQGRRQAAYAGPLLWTVLDRAAAIDPGKPREQVRQVATVTGRDNYSAVLALGEISPAFEGKQVLLALRMDGQPLAPEHLRLVVPGDKRGGRSVRDVVRIAVSTTAAPQAPR